MNFKCDRALLLEAVNIVTKVIPAKAVIPALEGILFNVYDDGKLKLTGFDLETGIETYINVEVKMPGSLIVNAKLFSEILRSMNNDIVNFDVDDKQNMNISSGVIKFVLPCISSDLFPDMPLIENEKHLVLTQKTLHSMIRQTIFAVAVNDSKPILKGILFDIDNSSISLVSSDNFRMALRKETFENSLDENLKFIVPGKALNELIKIMEESDEEIVIGLSQKHVSFSFSTVKIISRLLEGEFINYKAIIPSSFKTVAKVKTQQIKKTVERASLLIDEKVRTPVRLSLEYDSIIVSCQKAEGHSFTDEIKSEKDGENLEIGFNNKYLLGVLSACEDEDILLKLNSPLSSMSVMPVKDDKFFYLISPMRLRNE